MKKKLIAFLLALTTGTSVLFAQSGKCGDNVKWELSNGVLTISGTGPMTDYRSPWTDYSSSITSVIIKNGVTSIGGSAFWGCTNLSNITIPNSVKRIGPNAFYNCTGLKSIIIPNQVEFVGGNAFYNCKNLSKVLHPEGLDMTKAGIPSLAMTNNQNQAKPSNRQSNWAKTNTPSSNTNVRSQENTAKTQLPVKQPINPPLLALVDSLAFSDATSNNRIDADEKCTIKFKVQNNGKGTAENCEARIKLSGATKGISAQTVKLPNIASGQSYEVSVPITSNINTEDGNVTFSIEVYEPNGWGISPFDLSVATKAYEPPFLQVVDYNITSKSGKIRKVEPFSLTFNLQNTKYGDAKDVKVRIKLPEDVFPMVGETELYYPVVKSGEVKTIKVVLAANNKFPHTNIPVTIDIQEKHGKYAENKTVDIALNKTVSSRVNIAAKEDDEPARKPIEIASLRSDVDKNIPITDVQNENTFVLIIANEHYQQVASVPFAINDGNTFRDYCIKTLGINEKQILYFPDATGGNIRTGINKLAQITKAFDNPHIIVYYAGHGIPDESSKTAYLLPVDGSGSDVATGYKLDNLYATLGQMPASQITVFMDACFSGSKREEGMLASARGVALRAKAGVPQGKMVVFSAAQGDETAYPNREQQHGLFTYYLLKKIQETEGNIALKDLGDYVTKIVSQQSILLNSKPQTPCVTASSEVAQEWQNWKLK